MGEVADKTAPPGIIRQQADAKQRTLNPLARSRSSAGPAHAGEADLINE
jgi:hypothetical protein